MNEEKSQSVVLVIDDEVQIRRLLKISLEAGGYSMFTRPRTDRRAWPRRRSAGPTSFCWI